ncbi:MAG: hypothetical protein IKR86_06450 [Candidatus Methanomethylophilaceae archaeon]|nr:hypothetical protein [Candidatus Methanomethylophilaceae archaeon]
MCNAVSGTVVNNYSGHTVVNNVVRKDSVRQNVRPILDQGRYEGPTRDGVPHGVGSFFWPDGTLYEGEFSDGVIEGRGRKTYFDRVYEGDFHNNLREGRGKLIFRNGDVSEGEFKGDMRDGVLHDSCRDDDLRAYTYDGEYANDERQGRGEFRYSDGETYRGDVVKGF